MEKTSFISRNILPLIFEEEGAGILTYQKEQQVLKSDVIDFGQSRLPQRCENVPYPGRWSLSFVEKQQNSVEECMHTKTVPWEQRMHPQKRAKYRTRLKSQFFPMDNSFHGDELLVFCFSSAAIADSSSSSGSPTSSRGQRDLWKHTGRTSGRPGEPVHRCWPRSDLISADAHARCLHQRGENPLAVNYAKTVN